VIVVPFDGAALDRDAKFCAAFEEILEAAGIQTVTLPPRSPNVNAQLER
jgi:hypothetical protein